MIQVTNLSKSYGDHKAIQNINFSLEKGEIAGLLGLNGAGKTTTIRILTGYLIPSSGDAKINGKSIFDEPLEAKKRIGYLPESPPVYEDLIVQDYLEFVCKIKGVPTEKIPVELQRVMEKTQTFHVKDRIIGQLSLGYRKRVGIAQALIGNPDVIIMDEPISGLDPQQIVEIRNLIRSLGKDHTVLISSHILTEIYRTCDKFIFIHKGRIKNILSLKELEEELKQFGGLEVTLSWDGNLSSDEIEGQMLQFLKSCLPEEGNIEPLHRDGLGITFLIQTKNEKGFKKNLFQNLNGSKFELEYLKKQEATLEDLFMNRFQERKG